MAHVLTRPARRLLRWYEVNRRDFPWRKDRDPYRVWISEVMLQQTRAETVVPYYERFLERFPTVHVLAASSIEDVLALWSGLGYYRRARNLHAAAQQVVTAGGCFPETVEGLRELPGIGAYTAAAVASIAFGVAVPVVDGNVERVVSRLQAYGGDPKSSAGRRRILEHVAENLLEENSPGRSNQAVMELGATVCTSRRPRCQECPLNVDCRARMAGEPERYPVPRGRRQVERVRRAVVVVKATERSGAVLLVRRPETAGQLAGIWELPSVDARAGQRLEDREEIAQALGRRYGGEWTVGSSLGKVRHAITTRAFEVEIFEADLDPGEVAEAANGHVAGWFELSQLGELPISSLVTKVLERIGR